MTEPRFSGRPILNCFAMAAALASTLVCGSLSSQEANKQKAEDLPTSQLLSTLGPTFHVPQSELGANPELIVYGDQRFTDPANTKVTNPRVRQLLVRKLAQEHPDAILMNGDVPYSGDHVSDYDVFRNETRIWRDEHLHVYPALGNHEFHGDPQEALEHWWNAFPELRDRRWYSVELGRSIYTIALDSDTSLMPGSDQARWLDNQLKNLPASIRFVFISLHHPPVADFQTKINVSHNPRPNEIALRDYLLAVAPSLKAQLIVCAGHIHNYERFSRAGVTFLVSGGGAASPVPVERSKNDLYQDSSFPNYHYIKFVLKDGRLTGRMYRLTDPAAETPEWQLRDEFTIEKK